MPVVLSHLDCSNFLWLPQETKTHTVEVKRQHATKKSKSRKKKCKYNKICKQCSTSGVMKEVSLKTMVCPFTLQMAKIKKNYNACCGQGGGKQTSICCYWEQVGTNLLEHNMVMHIRRCKSHHIQGNNQVRVQRSMHNTIFIQAFLIQQNKKGNLKFKQQGIVK